MSRGEIFADEALIGDMVAVCVANGGVYDEALCLMGNLR